MKAKMMVLAGLMSTVFLTGCSSPAQRMAACEAQGISKDTCYLSEQNRQQGINNAAMAAAYANAANATAEQHAQAAHVADPMREATLSSNVLKATLSNGFFTATVNGKKATVKRINANFYEIHGAGYVISISMNANGIDSASWNKTHGRDNGILTVTQK